MKNANELPYLRYFRYLVGGLLLATSTFLPILRHFLMPMAKGVKQRSIDGVMPIEKVPTFPEVTISRPRDAWMSMPAMSADGSVFGLLSTSDGGRIFVNIDERTGREKWHTDISTFAKDFHRGRGWDYNKAPSSPQAACSGLPLAVEGGSHYLVTWKTEFALLARDTGKLLGVFSLREKVGKDSSWNQAEKHAVFSTCAGACFSDGRFWVGVFRPGYYPADDNDGGDVQRYLGIEITTDGTVLPFGKDGVPRPANCPPARSAIPGSGIELPEICSIYKNDHDRARKLKTNIACSRAYTDGAPQHEVMLFDPRQHKDFNKGGPVLRNGNGWTFLDGPGDFTNATTSFEMAGDLVFFNGNTSFQTAANHADRLTGRYENRLLNLTYAVNRKGELRWAYQKDGRSWSSVPVLLASPPDSPAKNLYAFNPGSLVAMDQATGKPLWQVGTWP